MKTNKGLFQKLMILMFSVLLLNSCKKSDDSSTKVATDETTVLRTSADDELRVSTENDEIYSEINEIALTNQRFRGMNLMAIISGNHIPCNATVDSSLISQGKLTIIFNGNTCNGNASRTGTITLHLPYDAATNTVTPWAVAGCVLNVTFNQYRITRLSNGKSITYNGSKQIINVNGGLVDDGPTFTSPIVHHITGMMQITFDNGATRTWNIDRTRTIERINFVTTITITGNATENGISNVSIWGINRHGDSFKVSIPTPVVLSSTCNFHAISGIRVHYGLMRVLTATYGVDQSGNLVTTGCPYGYKLNWINHQGNPVQVILGY